MPAYDDDDDEYDWRQGSVPSASSAEVERITRDEYIGLVNMTLDERGVPVEVKAEKSLLSSIDIRNLSEVFITCYREALWRMELPTIESGNWEDLTAFRNNAPARNLEGYSPARKDDGHPVVIVKSRNSMITSVLFNIEWAARTEPWVIAEEFRDACRGIANQLA